MSGHIPAHSSVRSKGVIGQRAAGLVLAALCFVFALALASCGDDDGSSPTPTESSTPSPTATKRPTASPSPTPEPLAEPPARDLLDLARRFYGYDGPAFARTKPFDHRIGDQVAFAMLDLETVEEYDITATLRVITDHAYFFVEDGASYTQSDLDTAAADFESLVWPIISGAFGAPPTPGVDGDLRITILNANLSGAGGFVAGSDGFPVEAVPRSNEREMMYVEADALGTSDYNALVAHELQHLIHQLGDPNEESWVNEGLSEVAWEMGGGSAEGVRDFLDHPDTQLNDWPPDDQSLHYSTSHMFFRFLLDHFGGRLSANYLVNEDLNGIAGVDAHLRVFYGRTFNEAFAEFVVANVLDDERGLYSHDNFDGTTTAITDLEAGDNGEDTVHQYGTDYYHLDGGTFTFDGSDEVTIGIPELDGPFWWSERSDGIDSRLTREVDLSDVTSATLEFDAWWDIEDGWDYSYVAVSGDGGDTWTTLPGTSTSNENPVSAAYGPGYTGISDGWQHQVVDLSAYAGDEIMVRFEYITDDAINQTGFAIDNISIAEIDLTNDGSTGNGWVQEGFQEIAGPLTQEFIMVVIGDDETIARPDIDANNSTTIILDRPSTISISGATPKTTEVATYTWSLQ